MAGPALLQVPVPERATFERGCCQSMVQHPKDIRARLVPSSAEMGEPPGAGMPLRPRWHRFRTEIYPETWNWHF